MSELIRPVSRRRLGLALSLPWLSGCGFGTFDPVRSIDARDGRIRIVTPWGESLRQRFEQSLAEWLARQSVEPVSIRWLNVTDHELETASFATILSSADVILGGHRLVHERSKPRGLLQAGLKPCRIPVFRTVRGPEVIASDSKAPGSPESRKSARIEEPPGERIPFDFRDDSNEPLDRAYFLSIFEDAPDQAAGYARWIRTVGSSVDRGARISGPYRVSKFSENPEIDRSIDTPWTGGPGMMRTLGVGATDPVHWPEFISWKSESGAGANPGLLLRFCEETGWLTRRSTAGLTRSQSTVIRDSMARIVRRDCRTELMQAWSEIQAATLTRRQETETYLTTPPPWPPASIQGLRQERGFEFVVALADQMAFDVAQRDWLVEEFEKPDGPIDFRMLETAVNGRLVHSTRSMAWLHAEWTAWLRQRCRRAVRYLRPTKVSHRPNPDFPRSGATFFT